MTDLQKPNATSKEALVKIRSKASRIAAAGNQPQPIPVRVSDARKSTRRSTKMMVMPESQSALRIKQIIQECEINDRRHDPKDWKDISLHPSYTNFQVPYFMQCGARYQASKQKYEEQFQLEIRQLLDYQSSAYEAARFNRHMCITTLWPPLHNRREIENTQRYFFPLSRKQRRRYQQIMTTNFT